MKKLPSPAPSAVALCLLAFGAQARAEQACIPPGIGNLPPVYPATESRNRIGGTTLLAATFDRCGKPTDVAIKLSSGSPGLDFSARRTVRSWTMPQLAGETVDIPIAFVPEQYELTEAERARPQLPVGGIERDAPRPLATRRPGYIRDARPMGFDSVAAAREYLGAPCASETSKARLCRAEESKLAEGVRWVQVSDACDLSWWVVADESSATGPFVVRDRMLYAPAIAEARTSYLCEGTAEQCEGVLAMLRNREDQPPAPPPLPPAPPGMCS